VIGLSLSSDEFCEVFSIPPELGQHVVAGGVCAVKQNNGFKHLPCTKKSYNVQTVAHSLAVRRVNIRLLQKINNKACEVKSSWRDAPDLSIS